MFIDVTTLEQLEEIKKLVQIKKKPNRKPFPKDKAVYAPCGQRCDLCVHYSGMAEEQREAIRPFLDAMWGSTDWRSLHCTGCGTDGFYRKDDPCDSMKCAAANGGSSCDSCGEYPCIHATVADYRSMIHTQVHMADEITWGILPYVPRQYED